MNVDKFKAIRLISPRLTGLISTTNEDGSANASPYSWVFPFSFMPPLIAVGVGKGGKHTQKNAEREKEFVINLVHKEIGQRACNLEKRHGPKQLEEVGLTACDSKEIKTKGIAESKARIECRYIRTIDVPEGDHVFVVGEIVAAECEAMENSLVDHDKLGILTHVSGPEFREVGRKVLLERGK